MKTCYIVLFLIVCQLTQAQTRNDRPLLAALPYHGTLIVAAQPLNHIRLERKEIHYYAQMYKDYHGEHFDSSAVAEIIDNSREPDLTPWTEAEWPKAVLVRDRGMARC